MRQRFIASARAITLGILVALMFVTAVCLYYMVRAVSDRDRLEIPELADVEPVEVSVPLDFDEKGFWEKTALEPRDLPITGRVVGQDLAGVAGLEVFCGPEVAVTDASGRFEFPPVARLGPLPVSIRRGHQEEIARWEGVVVGDFTPALNGESAPVRPSRIRWSVTLCGGYGPLEVPTRDAGERQEGREIPTEGLLGLGALLVEEWGASGRVHVDGWALVPDGAHVSLAFYFEGERFVAAAEPAVVQGAVFRARFFLPEDFHFYSGIYGLQLSFSAYEEDPSQVAIWKEERPHFPWDALSDAPHTCLAYIGFPEEELADNERVQTYYRKTLQAATGLKNVLERQFLDTLKLSKGWDPALLEERDKQRQMWLRHGAVGRDGEFLEEEWRTFLDGHWRPRVRELIVSHSQLTKEKFARSTFRMGELLKGLLSLSKMDSILLYEALGLPVHRDDFYYDDETAGGDRFLLLQIIKDSLEKLDRYQKLVAPREEPAVEEPPAGKKSPRIR